MIGVAPAPAPADFDERVRKPGLEALRELVGEARLTKRRGPRRRPRYARREDIKSEDFPDKWTAILPELRKAYADRCAWLALHIHHGTGTATVDHFVPKADDWRLAYEWSNYRLAAHLLNAKKGTQRLVDPFVVGPGWFELELVAFQVKPGPGVPEEQAELVSRTCAVLNDPAFCAERERYALMYERGDFSWSALQELAPFVASELERHGRKLASR